MDSYIFYKTICLKNDKYYYGVHKVSGPLEEDTYLGSGVDLVKDITLYGRDQFHRTIIMHSFDKELVDLAEAHYVRMYEINDPMCYNKKLGGDDLNHQSSLFKQKLDQDRFLLNFKEKRLKLGATTGNIIDYTTTKADHALVYKSKKKESSVVGNWMKFNSTKMTEEEKQREYDQTQLRDTNRQLKEIGNDIRKFQAMEASLLVTKEELVTRLWLGDEQL